MFGFSFGELVVLVIVGVIVIGPKDLPKVLRKLGQWATKARRMASELRAQSGIDDVLKGEGIADDIAEIRRLARGEIEGVVAATRIDPRDLRVDLNGGSSTQPRGAANAPLDLYTQSNEVPIDRDREYPREGASGYAALPDSAIVYADSLPKSPLARDPLYVLGDANATLEEPPAPPVDDAGAAAEPSSP